MSKESKKKNENMSKGWKGFFEDYDRRKNGQNQVSTKRLTKGSVKNLTKAPTIETEPVMPTGMESPKALVGAVREFIRRAHFYNVNEISKSPETAQEDIEILKAILFLYYLSRESKKSKGDIFKAYEKYELAAEEDELQNYEEDLHGHWPLLHTKFTQEGLKEASKAITLRVTDILTYSPILGNIVDAEYLKKIRNQLKKKNSAFNNEITWIRTILCALLARDNSSEEIELFDHYKNVLQEHKLPYEDLPELNTLLSYLTMYPFSNCECPKNPALEAVYLKLKAKGCSEEAILNLYWQSIHMNLPPQNQENTVQSREEIQSLITSIKQITVKHSDVIATVMEHRDGNREAIETGYVRRKFLEEISSKSKILVIHPSAFFVQKWPEKRMRVTTFCVMTDVEAKLFQEEFRNGRFCTAEELKSSSLSYYSHILYFQRPAETAESKQLAFSAIKDIERQRGNTAFMALIDQKETKLTEEALKQGYKKVYEYILPRQSFPNTDDGPHIPKLQKILIANKKVGYLDSALSCEIRKPRFVTNGVAHAYRDTISAEEDEDIYIADWNVFCGKSKSKSTAAKQKERVRKSKAFSKDITIWYSTKKHKKDKRRIEANIYRLPTSSQLNRNVVNRGKLIPDSYGSRVYSKENDADRWLVAEYPFQEKIQRAIIEAFNRKGRKELTIKTVWYLTMDISEYWVEDSVDHRLSDLMPRLWEITVKDCTTEKLKASIEIIAKERNLNSAEKQQCYEALEVLFDRFEKMGLCEDNPAFPLVEAYHQKRSTEDKIREALTKKSFTMQEMQKIYQYLQEKIAAGNDENVYLGVIMRLLTGLKSSVLCALQWQDICEIPGTGAHQFLIYKQAAATGTDVNFLTKRTEYRRFPVPTMLYRLLMEYREKFEEGLKKNNSVRSLKKTDYILASQKDLKENGSCQFLHPRRLIKAGNEAIRNLGFKNVEIYIPKSSNDDEDEKQTIDLGHYHGDIFNTNFRFHLKHDCCMLQSEENHLMGLTQKETFAKHYLDYNHDMKQLQMLEKMNRIEPLLVSKKPSHEAEVTRKDAALTVSPQVGYCAVAEYEFSSQQDAEITITIDSANGEMICYQIEEDANEES